MRLVIKVVGLLCLAAIFSGYMYADYQSEKAYQAKLELIPFTEVVYAHDTIDGILNEYYNKKNEGVSFNEFKYNTLHLKENKHLLDENGFLKPLQIGQRVTIKAKVLVEK